MPTAALGVIIVVAAAGLINFRPIWRLRHVRPAEVALALVASVGVLSPASSAASASRSRSPSVCSSTVRRGRTMPSSPCRRLDGYHDIARWEGAATVPGLRLPLDAPPFFVNAEYLRQRLLALVDGSQDSGGWCSTPRRGRLTPRRSIFDSTRRRARPAGITLCFAASRDDNARSSKRQASLPGSVRPAFPTVRAQSRHSNRPRRTTPDRQRTRTDS